MSHTHTHMGQYWVACMRATGSREEDEEDEEDEVERRKRGRGRVRRRRLFLPVFLTAVLLAILLRTDSLLPSYVRVSNTGRTGRKR